MARNCFLGALVVLVLVPGAMAQTTFGWTVSNSTTNPLSNSGPIAPGPSVFAGNLYLWLYCTNPVGMGAAEFDVVELTGVGGGTPVAFTGMNGFVNIGSPTAIFMAAPGCSFGPVLTGSFVVGPDASLPDIEICLVPSAANNRNVTAECGTGLLFSNDVRGFHKLGPASCSSPLCPDPPVSVEENSWGQIKGVYRKTE